MPGRPPRGVRQLSDESEPTAQQLAMQTYLPFGGQASAPYDAERMKFTGHERDVRAATASDDLDNMHARTFSPNLARFLSADPLRGNPSRPQSFNLFSYVEGNPSTFIDPYGLNSDMANLGGAIQVTGSWADGRVTAASGWGVQYWFFFAGAGPRSTPGGEPGGPVTTGPRTPAATTTDKQEDRPCEFMGGRGQSTNGAGAKLSPDLLGNPAVTAAIAYTFYQDAHAVRRQGHVLYPGTDANDPLRHMWANAQLASRWPSGWVRIAGIGNEVYGLLFLDLPDLRRRVSGERPWAFEVSDLEHNELGIALANAGIPCHAGR